MVVEPVPTQKTVYRYLAPHPQAASKLLFVKGRCLPTARVNRDMLANHRSQEESACNWNLPLAALHEIIQYCEANGELTAQMAGVEHQALHAAVHTQHFRST